MAFAIFPIRSLVLVVALWIGFAGHALAAGAVAMQVDHLVRQAMDE